MIPVQPEEMIGLWDSAPFDFGATESTRLALLPDGTGWTAVASTPHAAPARVRTFAWDCPNPEILELRYDDYEFVRAQYSLLAEALQLSQMVDSARRFALTRRSAPANDAPLPAPSPAPSLSPSPASSPPPSTSPAPVRAPSPSPVPALKEASDGRG